MEKTKIPLIVIAGPTASGKTRLSIDLCKHFNAQAVSADSMQIYKYMNVGTAKPTAKEMQGIKHHMIDFVNPNDNYSVSDYVQDASKIINDLNDKHILSVLVGGTGLYINSLVNNIQFTKEETNHNLRDKLYAIANEKGNTYVWNMLKECDEKSAEILHPNNIGRVIRAIEVYKTTGKTMYQTQIDAKSKPSPYKPIMICLNYIDRQLLYSRINKRVDIMLENGLIEETNWLFQNGFSKTAYQAIGYKEFSQYINGEQTLEECTEKLKMESRRYAKRQLTWFRRDDRYHVIYIDEHEKYEEILQDAIKYINKNLY